MQESYFFLNGICFIRILFFGECRLTMAIPPRREWDLMLTLAQGNGNVNKLCSDCNEVISFFMPLALSVLFSILFLSGVGERKGCEPTATIISRTDCETHKVTSDRHAKPSHRAVHSPTSSAAVHFPRWLHPRPLPDGLPPRFKQRHYPKWYLAPSRLLSLGPATCARGKRPAAVIRTTSRASN